MHQLHFISVGTDQLRRNTSITYLEETEVSRGQSAQSDDHVCANGAEMLFLGVGWGSKTCRNV